MAKQTGDTVFVGTWDCVTFYEMNGEFYVRMKSSLTGKRVKKDPAYALTRQYAECLAIASPIASVVYRTLPKDSRKRADYQSLTGMAIQLLKAGVAAAEVKDLLGDVGLTLLKEMNAFDTKPIDNKPTSIQEPTIEQKEAPLTFAYDEMECLMKLPLVVRHKRLPTYSGTRFSYLKSAAEKRLMLAEETLQITESIICT